MHGVKRTKNIARSCFVQNVCAICFEEKGFKPEAKGFTLNPDYCFTFG